jgi:hypothetical protein
MVVPIELSPLFERLLTVLYDNGAASPEGWAITQPELTDLVGFPNTRLLYDYLQRAKQHEIIIVRPTSNGTAFGMRQRGPDRYFLKVTPDEWRGRRELVAADRQARARQAISVKSKARMMEKSRLEKRARRIAAGAPPAAELDTPTLAVLVAAMDDDEDLAGW